MLCAVGIWQADGRSAGQNRRSARPG